MTIKHKKRQYRKRGFDYSSPGYYFITICTKYRRNLFGNIHNETIQLNNPGKIASNCLIDLQDKFRHISLDENIIMPDHIHAIIQIHRTPLIYQRHHHQRHHHRGHEYQTLIPNNPMLLSNPTLGYIVRHYKAITTYRIHKQTDIQGKIWQAKFHDHIIRNQNALENIRRYIRNNPAAVHP